MKIFHSMIAALGLALVPVAANAAQTDPEIVIYRFPGATDNGGAANTGVATAVHCTNFSGVTENIRYVARNFDGIIAANATLAIPHLMTRTAGTHHTALYAADLNLSTGTLNQGTIAIAATSTNIVCTAVVVDAAAATPVGLDLHGVRFNPIPGAQE